MYDVTTRFLRALRVGGTVDVSCTAWASGEYLGTVPVTGGTVTVDASKVGVRRTMTPRDHRRPVGTPSAPTASSYDHSAGPLRRRHRRARPTGVFGIDAAANFHGSDGKVSH